jgi:hypothetical protein
MPSPEKVVALVGLMNELMRRRAEHVAKEAQYQAHAAELAPKITERLYEIGLISDERKIQLDEMLQKSGSAPLQVLDEISQALREAGVNTLGTLYQPRPQSRGNTKKVIEVEDFVIDVSKYR